MKKSFNEEQKNENMVISQPIKNNQFIINFFIRNKVNILLIILIIILISLIIFFVNRSYQQSLDNKKKSDEIAQRNNLTNEINNKIVQGDLKAAEDLVNSKNGSLDLDKALQLSTIKLNDSKYQEILDLLLPFESNNSNNSNLMYVIARSYESLNNKEKAIEYYQKQINIIENGENFPLKDSEINKLKEKINQLKV